MGNKTGSAEDSDSANMVYVANGKHGDYANAALSVYWDSIHGDNASPRPILTYNPEALDDPVQVEHEKNLPSSLRKKLKGEVSKNMKTTCFRRY